MLEALKVIIFGIVEGITEWLPISSTGHLILLEELLHLKQNQAFLDMFYVVIQLGAILAVVVMYFHKLNPFSPKKTQKQFNNSYVVAATLIIYGILFIVIENYQKDKQPKVEKLSQLTIQTVLIIGVFQALALIPGTSRSGATIVGALLIGVSRGVAAEFTFFLAIPAMFGASFLKLIKFGLNFTGMQVFLLLLGTVVSFAVSILAIKFLMQYIRKHDFKVFGYYRIVLGVIVLLYFGIKTLLA